MSLTRLIRFLAILAVVLSPLAMLVGTPAQASSHHAMMMDDEAAPKAAGHCPDMDERSKDGTERSMDCAMACAATMPELADQVDAVPLPPAARLRPALLSVGHGLGPEATDPPPRSA